MFDNFNVNLRKNEGTSNLYSVYSYSGIRSIELTLRLKFILSLITVGYSTQNSGKLETLVGTNLRLILRRSRSLASSTLPNPLGKGESP